MRKFYLFLLIFSCIPALLLAQKIKVSGVVSTEPDQQTMPGVTVQIKGTTIGTTTDMNGYYEIEANPTDTLVFSYIGMESVIIPINYLSRIDVAMEEKAMNLGEVVVTGYSTDSKKLITGSLGVVGSDQIQNIPLRTIDGVLQGKESGLVINQNSGTPGGQMSVRLRGGSSINAGNDPLVVIDGIPAIQGNYGQISFSGQGLDAMNNLTPSQIESITVLKDASATAIYGARASNGVILITTRKGDKQKPLLDVSYSYGWQELPRYRWLDMLDADQWNEYKGTNVQGINTNWLDEVLRVAPTSNLELALSTGGKNTKLFVSGNYYEQDGIVLGTSFTRFSSRLNIEQTLSKHFKIGAGIGLSYSLTNRVEGDYSLNGPLPNAISEPPIYPVYDSTGAFDESGPYANPVAIATNAINEAKANSTNGNIFLEYSIIDGLKFTTKWGTDLYNLREHSYDPITTRQGARYNGLGIEASTFVSNIVSNNVLEYNKLFGKNNHFNALLGYSFEKYSRKSSYIEGIDFPNEQFQYIASAGTIRAASASSLSRGLNSFFGQVKYNYNYKYLVTITARADGSSKFGENRRYGFFPALSLAWRLSEETFMESATFISDLKIRAGIGQTGNDGIPDFASLGLYGGGSNYNNQSGIYPVQLANPDLRWETTTQVSGGLDISVWEERVSLTANFYYNHTKDLLLEMPLPPSSGFPYIYSNIGELQNKGMEYALSAKLFDKKFKWNSTFNIAFNKNKVLKLYNGEPIDDIGLGGNRVEVGQPAGVFYGYNWLGVDPSTGNLVYEDVNGDGTITADDRVITGDPNPDFTGGFTNIFSYGPVTLNIFLQFVYGNDIFNATRIYIESLTGEDNQLVDIERRWRQPGDITDIPRIGDTYKSSRFIEDGSFLKIKNITLSYDLPKKWMEKLRMRYTKIFVTVSNIYTFTNYSGMDPEVNYAGDDNMILGTDFFTYPQPQTISVGINLGF